MAKAAKPLTVSSSVLNRRALLRGGSLAAGGAMYPLSASLQDRLRIAPPRPVIRVLSPVARTRVKFSGPETPPGPGSVASNCQGRS